MTKVYIIYQQEYDLTYIYGVYLSKEAMETALNILSQDERHLKFAEVAKRDLQNWYDKNHVPWARYHGIEPQKPPARLGLNIVKFAKTLFHIQKLEADETDINPNFLGYDEIKEGENGSNL